MVDRKTGETTQVRTAAFTNSSRWTDGETRHLLEIWGTRYSTLRFKKRNFKDWEQIAKEFNKRCVINGSIGLGPRTGAQCKIRIKNILADYKRTRGEYSGQNSKQLFPFYETIDKIVNKSAPRNDSTELGEDFDHQEMKGGNQVTLQLPPEVQVLERPPAEVQVSSPVTPVVQTPVNTAFAVPSMVLTSLPNSNTIATTSMVANHISLAPLHSNSVETPMVESNSGLSSHATAQVTNSGLSSHATAQVTVESDRFIRPIRPGLSKKPLRKNPRPYKVVKVARKVNDDDKLLSVVREFMEERRQREEELFDKLFQQQAEAEKRYQEFTLNVIKEIGRLFRPEAFANSS